MVLFLDQLITPQSYINHVGKSFYNVDLGLVMKIGRKYLDWAASKADGLWAVDG